MELDCMKATFGLTLHLYLGRYYNKKTTHISHSIRDVGCNRIVCKRYDFGCNL